MKRILISRTDGVGDLLLTTPLIHELKKDGWHVGVLASKYAAPVLENNPDVDDLIIYEKGKKGLIEEIGEHKYDTVIAVFPRFEIGKLLKQANIPVRIATAFRWYSPLFFNKRIKIRRKESGKHEADLNLSLAKHITGKRIAKKLFFFLTSAEESSAESFLTRAGIKDDFVMIYPGGKGTSDNISEKQYAAFIDLLKQRWDKSILIASGKGEVIKSELIMKSLKDKERVYIMKEEVSLRELSAIILKSSVFISGSTGPMHIAAALSTKTLTFFPNNLMPIRWEPLGNEHVMFVPAKGSNMQSIDLEGAVEKTLELLEGN